LLLGVVDEVVRQVAAVELHAFNLARARLGGWGKSHRSWRYVQKPPENRLHWISI
jgi:hypothetical protein